MSALNLTEIVYSASIYNCTAYAAEVSQGTIYVGASCIANDATDASQILCPTDEEVSIPYESDCDSLVSTFVQWDPKDYVCAITCVEHAPTAPASELAARGLPYDELSAIANPATTLHPTNFLVSFAALFFVMLVFFKRM
ncbi:hypothetical protein BDF21DRAFT_422469 [Thamnidium elegans]|uniref:Uncharacterized protein n=1 Tax=Thamnidium elegans TaxID=101142 RepID=A0A8H7SPW8_9FUNG|nr:hypothetical protein INT48_005673 [Thamnidium elegans]KAI8076052.1 hypothetical protein BDF21DRAFT_422469 [Thamnidium elegans]